jgi:hypothetical protein
LRQGALAVWLQRKEAVRDSTAGSRICAVNIEQFKRVVVATLATAAGMAIWMPALAAPVWLTVLGDPADPVADTVQVDATSAVSVGSARLVSIRANRGKDRPARDGLDFRSYESAVLIDCAAGSARHRSQTLYSKPLWTGDARTVKYEVSDVRVMAFRGMDSNPKDRIIRAACSIDLVKSN